MGSFGVKFPIWQEEFLLWVKSRTSIQGHPGAKIPKDLKLRQLKVIIVQ